MKHREKEDQKEYRYDNNDDSEHRHSVKECTENAEYRQICKDKKRTYGIYENIRKHDQYCVEYKAWHTVKRGDVSYVVKPVPPALHLVSLPYRSDEKYGNYKDGRREGQKPFGGTRVTKNARNFVISTEKRGDDCEQNAARGLYQKLGRFKDLRYAYTHRHLLKLHLQELTHPVLIVKGKHTRDRAVDKYHTDEYDEIHRPTGDKRKVAPRSRVDSNDHNR